MIESSESNTPIYLDAPITLDPPTSFHNSNAYKIDYYYEVTPSMRMRKFLLPISL
ncbi:uncharacterized protein J3R85_008667 [Psidium guajava]|nr:uncharacterized protein J3R85_008667 [Psidium guajava]